MTEGDTQTETVDPRVRRTRKMLHDALGKLMQEKDFDKISVQDIADAADLHRATFYDHYPDKFALLECTVGAHFQVEHFSPRYKPSYKSFGSFLPKKATPHHRGRVYTYARNALRSL
jgi:AcrR family transcriptional regulator